MFGMITSGKTGKAYLILSNGKLDSGNYLWVEVLIFLLWHFLNDTVLPYYYRTVQYLSSY